MHNWHTSNRHKRLPKNWPQLVATVKTRAQHQCQATNRLTGTRCQQPGTDCDHITPGDNHSLNNLQLLCNWHHKQKTAREAARNHPQPTQQKPPEPHPGTK